MTDHVIEVTVLSDSTLRVADPAQNPLEVDVGDAVTWNFINAETLSPRVEFQVFLPADGSKPVMGPGNNPFGNQTPQIGIPHIVVGTAQKGLYLYTVFDSNSRVLHWAVPLFIAGSFNANFGGIPIPPGPP